MARSLLPSLLVPLTTLLSLTTADFIPYPNGTPPSTPSYNILTALEAAGVPTTDLPSLSNAPATNPAETTSPPLPTLPTTSPLDSLDALDTATPSHASIAFPTGSNITVLSLTTSRNKTTTHAKTHAKFRNTTNTDEAPCPDSDSLTAQNSTLLLTNSSSPSNTTLFSTTAAAAKKNGTFASLPASISKLRLQSNATTSPDNLNGTLPTNSTAAVPDNVDLNTNLTSSTSSPADDVDSPSSASAAASASASPPLPFLPASSSPAAPNAAVPSSFATSASAAAGAGAAAGGSSVAVATAGMGSGNQQQPQQQQAKFVTSGGERVVVGLKERIGTMVGGVLVGVLIAGLMI